MHSCKERCKEIGVIEDPTNVDGRIDWPGQGSSEWDDETTAGIVHLHHLS